MFTKIDHMLDHETHLNKFKSIKTYRVLSLTTVEFENSKNQGKILHILKLSSTIAYNSPLQSTTVTEHSRKLPDQLNRCRKIISRTAILFMIKT